MERVFRIAINKPRLAAVLWQTVEEAVEQAMRLHGLETAKQIELVVADSICDNNWVEQAIERAAQ